MSENQKVVALEGGQTPDKLAEAVRDLRKNLPNLIVAQELHAQVTRAKFVALVNQGFTVAEALELCK